MNKARSARDSAAENVKVDQLLSMFKGQPETYQLGVDDLEQHLGPKPFPDLKGVLRCTLNDIYKPATAAMSLVLRAGIEKKTDITFDLIREQVAKINGQKEK